MPDQSDLSEEVARQAHQHRPAPSIPTDPWRPLRFPVFRSLLTADLVSDVGAFMQSVGAAWLMVSLSHAPIMVALVQTVSTLPFFLLAIPAGSLADIVDRRKLILGTELWMLTWSVALAGLTIAGWMSPWLLLFLVLMVSMGNAVEAPAWQATLPELVPKVELNSALALNGIEFNIARAVGPGLAGLIVAVAGAGTAFIINSLSFLGVIAVIFRWKRPARKRLLPLETIGESVSAGFRYLRHAPALRGVLVRSGSAIFFASAFWALLPALAHDLGAGSIGYGLLLGCFGLGAVLGALLLSRLRVLASTEVLVSGAIVTVALVIAAVGSLHGLVSLGLVLIVGGVVWTPLMSVLNTSVQSLAPEWVRARILAFYLLVFQGSIAAGSALWGVIAGRTSPRVALLVAGAGLAALPHTEGHRRPQRLEPLAVAHRLRAARSAGRAGVGHRCIPHFSREGARVSDRHAPIPTYPKERWRHSLGSVLQPREPSQILGNVSSSLLGRTYSPARPFHGCGSRI
jgi:MFS family permease